MEEKEAEKEDGEGGETGSPTYQEEEEEVLVGREERRVLLPPPPPEKEVEKEEEGGISYHSSARRRPPQDTQRERLGNVQKGARAVMDQVWRRLRRRRRMDAH